MAMPGRNANPGSYRYGFNGKELDPEGMGGGKSTYDYGFRIYNPAIGRFLSVDPLTKSYPWYTPYQFAGNKPIWAIDLDGLEEFLVNVYIYKGHPFLILVTEVAVKDRAVDAPNTYVVIPRTDKKYHNNSSGQQDTHTSATGNPTHNPQWTASQVKQIGSDPESLIEESILEHNKSETPGTTKHQVYTKNRITFAVDESVINMTPETQVFIEKVAVILMKNTEMMVEINGYASVSHGVNDNQKLSQDRADAVKVAILNQVQVYAKIDNTKIPLAGIKDRITAVGRGEKQDDTSSNNSEQDIVATVEVKKK